jgi:hypothetical protein
MPGVTLNTKGGEPQCIYTLRHLRTPDCHMCRTRQCSHAVSNHPNSSVMLPPRAHCVWQTQHHQVCKLPSSTVEIQRHCWPNHAYDVGRLMLRKHLRWPGGSKRSGGGTGVQGTPAAVAFTEALDRLFSYGATLPSDVALSLSRLAFSWRIQT